MTASSSGGDVTLDGGREALRVREPKNGVERAVVLGPIATPRTLRGLRAARHLNSVDAAYREVDTALDHLSAALGLQHAA